MCTDTDTSRTYQPYKTDPEVAAYYVAPESANPSDREIWQAWDEAYYQYKKAFNAEIQEKQYEMEEKYYELQIKTQKEQMALQEELQAQQLQAQEDMNNLQVRMQEEQATATASLEKQRLQFEKESQVARNDSNRRIGMTQDAADKQVAFEAGRNAKNRKNAGGNLASQGTRSLQVGLNTSYDSATTAGLVV